MAGKPKDKSKEYSPEWGGKNRGGGKKPDGLIHRTVAMTFLNEDEYQAFMALTTSRSRVERILYVKD